MMKIPKPKPVTRWMKLAPVQNNISKRIMKKDTMTEEIK